MERTPTLPDAPRYKEASYAKRLIELHKCCNRKNYKYFYPTTYEIALKLGDFALSLSKLDFVQFNKELV